MLWISGDTVLYDGVREVADRLEVDTRDPAPRRRPVPGVRAAALHDDRPRGGRARAEIEPAHVVPIHFEGWKHFREGRAAIESELATAPDAVRDRVRWLELGVPTSVT